MTTIGPSLIITGEITSREDITIHGRVNGHVRMDSGGLLVAPTGTVDANLLGTRVTIHGTVAGDVAATERIELTPTANVTGTLTTTSIVLQDGATFNGVVDIDGGAEGEEARTRCGIVRARKPADCSCASLSPSGRRRGVHTPTSHLSVLFRLNKEATSCAPLRTSTQPVSSFIPCSRLLVRVIVT